MADVTLYHWEPNANSGKPMLALMEKGGSLLHAGAARCPRSSPTRESGMAAGAEYCRLRGQTAGAGWGWWERLTAATGVQRQPWTESRLASCK